VAAVTSERMSKDNNIGSLTVFEVPINDVLIS
jgi:hypothetical protein